MHLTELMLNEKENNHIIGSFGIIQNKYENLREHNIKILNR